MNLKLVDNIINRGKLALAKLVGIDLDELIQRKVTTPQVSPLENAPAILSRNQFIKLISAEKPILQKELGRTPSRTDVKWRAIFDYVTDSMSRMRDNMIDILQRIHQLRIDADLEARERKAINILLVSLVVRCASYEEVLLELSIDKPEMHDTIANERLYGHLGMSLLLKIAEQLAEDSDEYEALKYLKSEYPVLSALVTHASNLVVEKDESELKTESSIDNIKE